MNKAKMKINNKIKIIKVKKLHKMNMKKILIINMREIWNNKIMKIIFTAQKDCAHG